MLNGDDLPPLLHGHYPTSSLLRGSPPLSGASVLSASRLEPLVLFPLASPARFSRSVQEPGRASRCLHAGCRSVGIRTSTELIPEDGSAPGFDITYPENSTPKTPAESTDVSSLRVGNPPMATNPISTLQKQFACARLSRPCLPGSSSRLFRNAHHHGF